MIGEEIEESDEGKAKEERPYREEMGMRVVVVVEWSDEAFSLAALLWGIHLLLQV